MQCDYFDAHACRSCTLMGQSYDAQLHELQKSVAVTLGDHVGESTWETTGYGAESHFRNKAKLAVGGTRSAPTFGIVDRDGGGIDLRDCGLHEAGLHHTITQLADFVTDLGLTPYDIPRRTGELKHLIITHSPDGDSMIRFVLRSPGQLGRIERALPALHEAVPSARVVSVNLLPEHKAALEGAEEIVLTDAASLPMRVNDVTLHLRPRSFFQTNTAVAAQLYRQAQQWISQIAPQTVLDLFCGVGGFALHAATTPGAGGGGVRGVEISEDAVASANRSAAELSAAGAQGAIQFEAGDAAAAFDQTHAGFRDAPPLRSSAPQPPEADLVIVNPPRRGIGELAGRLEESTVPAVLYSSCNASSLAEDLGRMPSYRVTHARLFDMFPQTRHHEVLLLLER